MLLASSLGIVCRRRTWATPKAPKLPPTMTMLWTAMVLEIVGIRRRRNDDMGSKALRAKVGV